MEAVCECRACGAKNSSRSLRCVACGADVDAPTSGIPADPSLVGRRAGSYEIVSLLSGSSRAAIYRAVHSDLRRPIALKVLGSELASDERAKARFSREGRALARLEHPYVVAIHEVGAIDGRPFLAMALHEGATLRDRLSRGRIPIEHAAGIARALAAALDAIHTEGVIHRDLKPENVVFPHDGGMKIVDFGLSRLDDRGGVERQETLTLPGAVLGTLPYLAPEQLLGEKVDARADLWALGVITFEMLAGTTPFGESEHGTVAAILDRGPRRLAAVAPAVPAALADVVDGLLVRSRADRPASAKEVEARIVAAFPSLVPPELQGATEPLEPGEVIGDRMRIIAEIARGASGTVWRGEHLVLGTPCAVKFLQDEASMLPKNRARFIEEARTLAKLDSDRIVRVLDAGTHRARPYLAMELLEGETLETRIERDGRLAPSDALTLFGEIAEALDAAHGAGIVHRDLKPSNVFLRKEPEGDSAGVKILDFGIAKAVGEAEGSTHGGTLVDSPGYLSPEQIDATGKVDRRTDLWSLGVTTFRVLTGELPFTGSNVTEICEAISKGVVPSARSANPSLPVEIDAWFSRALAHRARDRFDSAGEMIARLGEVLGAAPPRKKGALEPASPVWNVRAIIGFVLALVVVGAAGVLVGSWLLD